MYSKVALQHEDPNDLQSSVVDLKSSKFHGPILSTVRRLWPGRIFRGVWPAASCGGVTRSPLRHGSELSEGQVKAAMGQSSDE